MLQVTWVSEKHRIRKVMSLKAPKLEHLDNVTNRCWDQNLAGIPEMGTSNILGRTQSKMGYNVKKQSMQWQSGRETTRRTCTGLMEQISKNNSKIADCQKLEEGRGSLLVVKLQHHQFTNLQHMDQPIPHLRQHSRVAGHGQHYCWSAAGWLPQLCSTTAQSVRRVDSKR